MNVSNYTRIENIFELPHQLDLYSESPFFLLNFDIIAYIFLE